MLNTPYKIKKILRQETTTMTNEVGTIFDIKRFAIYDGPGIRTTVFFKGCPLHCPWCHNPEGITQKKELITYPHTCITCHQCIPTCPNQAITYNNHITTNHPNCTACGTCTQHCPTNSRQLIGQKITTKTLTHELLKDHLFYEESSGGITISGGEPLYQPAFLTSILNHLKKHHLHITIDTAGYAPTNIFTSTLNKTDLLLYDLKIINDTLHQKYTGVSNQIIKKNLTIAQEKKIPTKIRYTIIPGITDTDTNIQDLLTYLQHFQTIQTINLLPYHNVQEKYERLGKTYALKKTPPPTKESIQYIKKQCENSGYHTTIGG